MDLYSAILDTSKFALKADVRLQTVLDDLSFAILDSKIEDIRSTEFGFFPVNVSKYSELKKILKISNLRQWL